MINVAASSAAEALAHIEAGGVAFVRTHLRLTILDRKVLRRFQKADAWLLKDDGEGIRLRAGNGSDYLFAGQLRLVKEG